MRCVAAIYHEYLFPIEFFEDKFDIFRKVEGDVLVKHAAEMQLILIVTIKSVGFDTMEFAVIALTYQECPRVGF